MERGRWQRIRGLLEQALALDASARDPFLARACGGDNQLRAEVESILDSSERTPDFLHTSLAQAMVTRATDDVQSLLGQTAGLYRLDRFIASGGMGSVYVGTSVDGDAGDTAAVKLLKHRAATDEMLRRFRVERQSLAVLNHPNIARAIDAGVMTCGRPYLVMEYVEGIPIDQYCDERRLSIRQRLELFRAVCSAVAHAHQRLIVHRDLKPSNILVTTDGTPKLLDFGISKALDTLSAAGALPDTQTQFRVMTPEYASPEQIRGALAATSGDVYSLGVVLYELLTGHRPYRFKSRTPHEMERTICEQEPDTPSNAIYRISSLESTDTFTGAVPSPERVGQARNEHPSRLRSQLTGDLDAIVMKSLRKEPEHRYSSVEAFSEDVARNLSGAPVSARKGSRRYRFLKFVSRHKATVGGSTIAVVALVVGLAAAVWQGHLAVEAQQVAETEAENARSVHEFLQDMLSGVDPLAAGSDGTTLRQILDDATTKLSSGAMKDQPASRASVHLTVGMTYLELGIVDSAQMHLDEALTLRTKTYGREHADVAECLSALGMVAKTQGEYGSAETLYRDSLAIRESVLGHRHIETAESLNNLAVLLKVQGRYHEAESLLREALQIRKTVLSDIDPDVAATSSNLAAVLKQLGEFDESEALYREALKMFQDRLGPEHLRVAGCMNNLALLLRERGQFKTAKSLLRDALTIRRKVFGDDHEAIGTGLHNLGLIVHLTGDTDEAEHLYRQALEIRRKVHGADHPRVANTANNLADLMMTLGLFDEARALTDEALRIRRAKLPPNHPRIAGSLLIQGRILLRLNDATGSEPILREALAISEDQLPGTHRQVITARLELGTCLTRLERYDEAESLLLGALAAIENDSENANLRTLTPQVLAQLISLYTTCNNPVEVARYEKLSQDFELNKSP